MKIMHYLKLGGGALCNRKAQDENLIGTGLFLKNDERMCKLCVRRLHRLRITERVPDGLCR